MRKELAAQVIEAMAKEAKVEGSEIDMTSTLWDLGIDSLSALEILVALEKRLEIRIPEEDLKNTSSIAEIVRTIVGRLEEKEKDR